MGGKKLGKVNKFSLILFLLFASSSICSQSKQILSGEVMVGGFFPVEHFINDAGTGFAITSDFEARNNNFGVFFGFTYNNGKQIINASDMEFKPQKEAKHVHVLEFSFGPRWYIGNRNKLNGSIDAGLGYYRIIVNGPGSGSLGIRLAGGLNHPLSENISVGVTGKYNILAQNMGAAFGNISLGIIYYFNK